MANRKRHWKQRWDPTAELVFARRLRIGDNPKKPFALPGEKVTKKHREKLGANRLRMWFENGTLALANFEAPDVQRRLAIQERKKREQLEAKIEAERVNAEQEAKIEPAVEGPELPAEE